MVEYVDCKVASVPLSHFPKHEREVIKEYANIIHKAMKKNEEYSYERLGYIVKEEVLALQKQELDRAIFYLVKKDILKIMLSYGGCAMFYTRKAHHKIR